MKHLSWAVCLMAVCAAATGQTAGSAADTTLNPERERISAERARAQARYASEEAACYKKFAVNDCLNAAKAARGEVLADLRRQEILLNNAERKQRGAQQLQRIEDKTSLEKRQQAASQRERAQEEHQGRQQRAAEKSSDRAQKPADESAKRKAYEGKQQSRLDKDAARASKASSATAERSRYNEKLEDAQERKARRDKDRAEARKPPAKPLPTPP
ncbi:MAG: hypothetical protein ACRECD_06290 [Burkholderiaceae bacterium]